MLFAAWPAKPKLPQFVCAIEFTSEEEASKFEPQLKNFLPKLLPSPSPTAPSASSATASTSPQPVSSTTPMPQSERKTPAAPTEAAPPYFIQHAGTLVLLSNSKFNFKDLRPAGTKLLREDEKFRIVHDRFGSEPLFLFFDFQTEDRSRPQPSPPPKAQKVEAIAIEKNTDSPDSTNDPGPSPEIVVDDSANPVVAVGTDQQTPTGESTPSPAAQLSAAMSGLSRLLFDGPSSWPNAIGLGIAFDAESYVIRSLFVNSEENRNVIIPFAPQLLAGPALSSAAVGILPADTEMFISASFDFAGIHDGMIETARRRQEETLRLRGKQVNFGVEPESPFLAYEKGLGINLKKDLIPLLGNEVALAVPLTSFFPTTQPPTKDNSSDPNANAATAPEEPAVILAISVRDREGMRALLPKMIDSIGVKGASLLAQTERREDTELISYGSAFSYAFVGDFLVSSTSAKAVRNVVDSYLNRQTLASDSDFHNFTRWQPRQILGQVYVSTKLMKSYEEFASDLNAISDERLRDFIMSLTPAAEPITYSLADEGWGPLHELHLPRKLLLLMIAGISAGPASSPMTVNESVAQGGLRMIAAAEESFKSTKGQGRYGSIQELIDEGLLPPDTSDRYGYKIDLTVFGSGFEARATPAEYGKTGKRSYYIDQSSVLRGGDHGGGSATVADQPVQ
jgi:hypothetical protein